MILVELFNLKSLILAMVTFFVRSHSSALGCHGRQPGLRLSADKAWSKGGCHGRNKWSYRATLLHYCREREHCSRLITAP